MRKFFNKLLAVVATVAMVLSLAVLTPVKAAGEYTITINNAKTGHTYEAYQIFTGDLADGVLSNVEWGNGVIPFKYNGSEVAAVIAESLDGADSAAADAFAKEVVKHLSVHTDSTYDNGVYTITGLDAGYYLVKDLDGSISGEDSYTKYMIKVVKNVEATPKSDVPTAIKKVYENVKKAEDPMTGAAGTNYNDVADYNIGDDVPFAFYSNVPDMSNYETYKYVFEDKMDAGLSFNNDVTVTIGNNVLEENVDYTVKTSDLGENDECDFHVEITDLKKVAEKYGIEVDTAIRVDFTAELNSQAVIGLDGNVNQMRLKFSNNPNDSGTGSSANGETPWDKVIVFTYELDITKVDSEDTTQKLKYAEFVLYRDSKDNEEYVKVDSDSKVIGWTTDKKEASVLNSGDEGTFKVIGLDDGTYYLEETKAPTGYNLLANHITLVIAANTENNQSWGGVASNALKTLTLNNISGNLDTGIVATDVENTAGSKLPETGGIGNYVFYAAGAVLMITAAFFYLRKRKENDI